MITYKIRNNATNEELLPVKMGWNEKGKIVSLIGRNGGNIEVIELVDNWEIVPVYTMDDEDVKRVVEANKEKKDKWRI